MSARTIAMCLTSRLWFYSLFNSNLLERRAAEAPVSLWDNVARSMELTAAQVRFYLKG
jgi:hypothetical protein